MNPAQPTPPAHPTLAKQPADPLPPCSETRRARVREMERHGIEELVDEYLVLESENKALRSSLKQLPTLLPAVRVDSATSAAAVPPPPPPPPPPTNQSACSTVPYPVEHQQPSHPHVHQQPVQVQQVPQPVHPVHPVPPPVHPVLVQHVPQPAHPVPPPVHPVPVQHVPQPEHHVPHSVRYVQAQGNANLPTIRLQVQQAHQALAQAQQERKSLHQSLQQSEQRRVHDETRWQFLTQEQDATIQELQQQLADGQAALQSTQDKLKAAHIEHDNVCQQHAEAIEFLRSEAAQLREAARTRQRQTLDAQAEAAEARHDAEQQARLREQAAAAQRHAESEVARLVDSLDQSNSMCAQLRRQVDAMRLAHDRETRRLRDDLACIERNLAVQETAGKQRVQQLSEAKSLQESQQSELEYMRDQMDSLRMRARTQSSSDGSGSGDGDTSYIQRDKVASLIRLQKRKHRAERQELQDALARARSELLQQQTAAQTAEERTEELLAQRTSMLQQERADAAAAKVAATERIARLRRDMEREKDVRSALEHQCRVLQQQVASAQAERDDEYALRQHRIVAADNTDSSDWQRRYRKLERMYLAATSGRATAATGTAATDQEYGVAEEAAQQLAVERQAMQREKQRLDDETRQVRKQWREREQELQDEHEMQRRRWREHEEELKQQLKQCRQRERQLAQQMEQQQRQWQEQEQEMMRQLEHAQEQQHAMAMQYEAEVAAIERRTRRHEARQAQLQAMREREKLEQQQQQQQQKEEEHCEPKVRRTDGLERLQSHRHKVRRDDPESDAEAEVELPRDDSELMKLLQQQHSMLQQAVASMQQQQQQQQPQQPQQQHAEAQRVQLLQTSLAALQQIAPRDVLDVGAGAVGMTNAERAMLRAKVSLLIKEHPDVFVTLHRGRSHLPAAERVLETARVSVPRPRVRFASPIESPSAAEEMRRKAVLSRQGSTAPAVAQRNDEATGSASNGDIGSEEDDGLAVVERTGESFDRPRSRRGPQPVGGKPKSPSSQLHQQHRQQQQWHQQHHDMPSPSPPPQQQQQDATVSRPRASSDSVVFDTRTAERMLQRKRPALPPLRIPGVDTAIVDTAGVDTAGDDGAGTSLSSGHAHIHQDGDAEVMTF